ncbi:hypothetical protein AB0J38_14315 [Streptomyces sp. NPDC050095]|uniref:hypothetical protein n=1 Tax=unclassified Streptomyces TaxID=2593676 RepID=UPI0034181F1C
MPADKTPITLDPTLDPWEQQRPRESDDNYRRFEAYRDMKDRKVRALAVEIGRSPAYLQKLATRMHWAERARAWDVEQRRKDEAVLDEARRAHAKQMVAATGLALRTLVKGWREDRDLSNAELIRLQQVLAQAIDPKTVTVQGSDEAPAIRITAVPLTEEDRLAELRAIAAAASARAEGTDDVTIAYGDEDDE